MSSKINVKTRFSHPLPLPPVAQRDREWELFCSCPLFLLLLRERSLCSNMRSLPQEIILHELFHYESIPWAAALHKMLQNGSLFHRVPSFRYSLLQPRSPTGIPARKPAPVWALSPWLCRSLPGACTSLSWVHSLLRAPPGAAPGSLPPRALHASPWAAP